METRFRGFVNFGVCATWETSDTVADFKSCDLGAGFDDRAGAVGAKDEGVFYPGEDEVPFLLDDPVDWVDGDGGCFDDKLVGEGFGIGSFFDFKLAGVFGRLPGGLVCGDRHPFGILMFICFWISCISRMLY